MNQLGERLRSNVFFKTSENLHRFMAYGFQGQKIACCFIRKGYLKNLLTETGMFDSNVKSSVTVGAKYFNEDDELQTGDDR